MAVVSILLFREFSIFPSYFNHIHICAVSELSFQEGSVYNSEMECTNLDQQSQTEPLDIKLVQCEQRSENQCNSFNAHDIKLALDQQSDTHYSLVNLNAAGDQLHVSLARLVAWIFLCKFSIIFFR